jgi:hypothetical protein
MQLGELEENELIYQLPDCFHVFAVESLDE